MNSMAYEAFMIILIVIQATFVSLLLDEFFKRKSSNDVDNDEGEV